MNWKRESFGSAKQKRVTAANLTKTGKNSCLLRGYIARVITGANLVGQAIVEDIALKLIEGRRSDIEAELHIPVVLVTSKKIGFCFFLHKVYPQTKCTSIYNLPYLP